MQQRDDFNDPARPSPARLNPLERAIAQEEIDLRALPVGPEFTTWLLRRTGEAGRTHVGDLALEVYQDTEWPYLARDLWELRRYLLEERVANDGAAEALWEAYVRWRSRTTGPAEPNRAGPLSPSRFRWPLPPGHLYVTWPDGKLGPAGGVLG